MVKGTLNELSQLRDSGFGQPAPRHGLNLLYWFVHEYIELYNDDVVLNSNPQNGAFGFHNFLNTIEDEDHIVPIQTFPYYEVGNLNAKGADKLPSYVRANYSHNEADSNKDRIIVRLDYSGALNRVYVTEHSDKKLFDNSKTYRVSVGLLKIIKNMNRERYLSLLSIPQMQHIHVTQQSAFEREPENNSWCAIL
ncbi:uncharacterized protein LOC127444037 [Myxocyprinus asiaticus]|uniref:uncharacterized protein LOC127444037 n=1 Tax=Myxocyprinus asiaticus TaxID=70543 RepID=UPI002222EDD7|nr:uncharacterized protein LOC127444037 [Myxocyprinus asiaticus]